LIAYNSQIYVMWISTQKGLP